MQEVEQVITGLVGGNVPLHIHPLPDHAHFQPISGLALQ
jgi:hypothetical protein